MLNRLNRLRIFALCLFLSVNSANSLLAQVITGKPSLYYTSGNYSDSRSSSALDFYLPLGYNYQWYFSAGLQNMEIKGTDWSYNQKGIPLSAGYYSYPYYVSLHAMINQGDYTYLPAPGFDYTDYGNLAGGEVLYYSRYTTFGLGYTYENQRGILTADSLAKISVQHVTGRIALPVTPELYISLRPHFTATSEAKKLFSLSAKIIYAPLPDWLFTAGGFAGIRVYHFDNDSFALFNQFETQKYQYSVQAEYKVHENLRASAGYTKTGFSGYSIQYIFAGLSFPFVYY